MADRITLGRQYLADLFARIPEDQRAVIQPVLESEDVAAFIGDGVLRQSDYSRLLNDLQARSKALDKVHDDQVDWYNVNKAALEAAAGRSGEPAPQPTGVDRKFVEDLVNERETGVGSFVAQTSDLQMRHFKTFGEPLSLTELMADPEAKSLGILGVYQKKFATKYAEKAKAEEDARVDAKVKELVDIERKKFSSNPPYPVSPHDPSPLDVLDSKDGSDKYSAQAAADEYQALVAKRMSSPG